MFECAGYEVNRLPRSSGVQRGDSEPGRRAGRDSTSSIFSKVHPPGMVMSVYVGLLSLREDRGLAADIDPLMECL